MTLRFEMLKVSYIWSDKKKSLSLHIYEMQSGNREKVTEISTRFSIIFVRWTVNIFSLLVDAWSQLNKGGVQHCRKDRRWWIDAITEEVNNNAAGNKIVDFSTRQLDG